MLNAFAKFLLVSTSLSPLLGAVAVNQLAHHEPTPKWLPWVVTSTLLVLLCWLLFLYAARNAQKVVLHVESFERNDHQVLAFLVTYLLPFLASKNMAFTGDWLTGAYILAVIFLVVAHTGVFHFNPVMALLGYHFYTVKSSNGVSQLLISRDELRRPQTDLSTVRLATNVYLRARGAHA